MSAATLSLVILAGGLGSRFGGAKQVAVLPGLQKTIMQLSIEDAYKAGVRHVVLVINQQVRAALCEHILPQLPKDISVDLVEQHISDVPAAYTHLVHERNKPWGTGHALLCARDKVRDKAIVITADDYYGEHAYQQMVAHFEHSAHWACVAYPVQSTCSEQGGVNRGICQLNSHNQLQRVDEVLNIQNVDDELVGYNDNGERLQIDSGALASMTFWGVGRALFDVLADNFERFLAHTDNGVKKEYYLPDQIQYCIDHHLATVDVYPATQPWLGMTYKDELAVIAKKIKQLKGLSNERSGTQD
ncbi:hypothetical protein EXT46_16915 [Pseudoalteromonas sp. CO325X]|uniref:sugar phosphate nucleotidyltransferase n=1 Tax=Pseudoalteromonas sp. CO325X TaxID=1777262 RepID=UPI001023AC09|nr:sugar phosphate nucleotidyltransferase [Pseudoalteromonas sp. CO325X]RZF77804.1 hypothetical protein EXT46_16915 [Pseudoalteromonas sp. CO325X]